MKQKITRSQLRDAFSQAGRYKHFSSTGRNALFDCLEGYEIETGVELDIDVVSLCIHYAEERLVDVLRAYKLESIEDLKKRTIVIKVDDETIIYRVF